MTDLKVKKLQTLQELNMYAAKELVIELKRQKCLSEINFYGSWNISHGYGYSRKHSTDPAKTTKKFLIQHGLVTTHKANGLRIWVATQKCVRTKMENIFKG